MKSLDIDYRVAQLDKEFTLNGAHRSGFWEEFEVGFVLNVLLTALSSVCSLTFYAAQC